MVIIFYSAVSGYAIDGYSVDALDFLLKPATKYDVFKKLDRAIHVLQRNNTAFITLRDGEGNMVKVNISDIRYIEKERNLMIFGAGDKTYKERKNLYEMEDFFAKYGFAKCRSGVMINLRYVEKYNKEAVFVDGKEFWVSRGEHDAFFAKLMNYYK